ncbi:MAG: hypothetical protein M1836_001025 [Candelina mexicana]|nr:MAG: hypothetical protein M1836_001025 [Candelina mexicana]
MGDSITQQSSRTFAARLQDAYIRRLDVINRGFSGYNTSHALIVLSKIVPKPAEANLRFVTIFFGANDACLEGTPTNQHVSLYNYGENLINIMTDPLIRDHKPHVILITPTPVDERLMEKNADNSTGPGERLRTAENTRRYAKHARELGRKYTHYNVAVLDLWTIFMTKAGWKEGEPLPGRRDVDENPVLKKLLHDGLHFNPEAYELLFEELMKLIKVTWPDQDPEQLPYVLPSWEIAPKIANPI